MAQDTFIKINGIEGESQDASHLNEIDVIVGAGRFHNHRRHVQAWVEAQERPQSPISSFHTCWIGLVQTSLAIASPASRAVAERYLLSR